MLGVMGADRIDQEPLRRQISSRNDIDIRRLLADGLVLVV